MTKGKKMTIKGHCTDITGDLGVEFLKTRPKAQRGRAGEAQGKALIFETQARAECTKVQSPELQFGGSHAHTRLHPEGMPDNGGVTFWKRGLF